MLATIPIAENVYAGGRSPMKKDHPGVQPDAEASYCPRAYAAECLPAAALADRHINITIIPRAVQIAHRISMLGSSLLRKRQKKHATAVTARKIK